MHTALRNGAHVLKASPSPPVPWALLLLHHRALIPSKKYIYIRKHKSRKRAKSQRCGLLLLKPERKMECIHTEEGREWGRGGSAIAGLQLLPSPCRAVLQPRSPAALGADGSSHQQRQQQGRAERSCTAACTISYSSQPLRLANGSSFGTAIPSGSQQCFKDGLCFPTPAPAQPCHLQWKHCTSSSSHPSLSWDGPVPQQHPQHMAGLFSDAAFSNIYHCIIIKQLLGESFRSQLLPLNNKTRR